ncbi:matrixin family metalloprotease [Myxococcus sp. K15C18031901]|uniref:myxosortase-dependent metalloprotease, MXAN_2677/MXAN_2678 family n=1 Tax=Myxococcus dinghuensis TaxID=2906761 RepID=UPI0020A7D399|nr:myxosortase-dependent metalloprotease, MXAN_2677/MXAN_2678 family [Myxococcus dinghuensis]MCP3105432.1 matrixin family metalloprotease [Myxococcus dinghuensis]
MSRGLVLAALVVAAGPAFAQDDFSFRRTRVVGQPQCLLWPVRDYVYHLDAAGSARTPGDTEVGAIEAAFDSWRAVSRTCSDYRFVRSADWKREVVVGFDKEHRSDNYNIITFRERSCDDVVAGDDVCWDTETCGNQYDCWEHGMGTIALTTSTYSLADGRVLDADIELNASDSDNNPGFLFTTVDSPPCVGVHAPNCVSTDLQNTMTHEIGHVVGLDHVPDVGSTMQPTAPEGETRKRVIDSGSVEGFCSIYPRYQPPNQCVALTNPSVVLQADGRGTGCDAAPGALAAVGWLSALALLRARRRPGARRRAAA